MATLEVLDAPGGWKVVAGQHGGADLTFAVTHVREKNGQWRGNVTLMQADALMTKSLVNLTYEPSRTAFINAAMAKLLPGDAEAETRAVLDRALLAVEHACQTRGVGGAADIPPVRAANLQTAEEVWATCATLAKSPDILARVSETMSALGVVGEERVAKLIYLIGVSRLLQRPVSGAIKGPSSVGKNFVTQAVLNLFPPDAYYALSGMSERALAYDTEPLQHRMLVIYEAVGMSGDFQSYLIRSLLSEGRLSYVTVEKTKDGMRPRRIEREGPTSLLVTTTAVALHPENETRLLSIPTTDSPAQTKAILLAMSREKTELDLRPWHALDQWLADGERRVAIDFKRAILERVPPVAVRLRRDIRAALTLVEAHALLHRETRATDADGRIVATVEDYRAVRDLVLDIISEGVGASVSATIRATVEAVNKVIDTGASEATVTAVAAELELEVSSAWRRVKTAIHRGYLKNLEDRKHRPARLVLDAPLPAGQVILPEPEVCGFAAPTEGISPDADLVGNGTGTAVDRDALFALARERGFPHLPLRAGVAVPAGERAWMTFTGSAAIFVEFQQIAWTLLVEPSNDNPTG